MAGMPVSSDWLLRTIFSTVSPAGARSRLSTLIFHRVLAERDPLQPGEVTLEDFDQILGWISNQFNVIGIREAIQRLNNATLPARPLVITFDDGYADNFERAAPALRRFGLPATFFIASGYLNGGRMFNDTVAAAIGGCAAGELDLSDLGLGRHSLASIEARRSALSKLLPQLKPMPIGARSELAERIVERADVTPPTGVMMTSEQVAALHRDGFEIGAHTDMHPILARLDHVAAREEIQSGRRKLEAITTATVDIFAYPNGRPGEDFTDATVEIVRELKFDAALTTAPGVGTSATDPFQLPRFTPWDRSRLGFGRRMFQNMLNHRGGTGREGSRRLAHDPA